jgi:hypothetical protein
MDAVQPFKKSEFTELQDISTPSFGFASAAHTTSETKVPMTSLEVDETDLERIPIEETWSWNPVDWYHGIVREIRDFKSNFEMTERKKVMYRAILGEGLVTFLFMFIVMVHVFNKGNLCKSRSFGLFITC